MKEKVSIEKGSVQETLMLPLFGRYKANNLTLTHRSDPADRSVKVSVRASPPIMAVGDSSFAGTGWPVHPL